MANIKSQIKRNRQNNKRRLRNRVYRGSARTAVKNARTAITLGEPENSKKAVLEAIRELDRAAEKGVIHKNNAARRKSRLMKQYAKMGPAAVAARVEPKIEEPVVEAKPKRGGLRSKPAVEKPAAEVKPKAEVKAKAAAKPKAEAKPKVEEKSKAKTETKTKTSPAAKAKKPAAKTTKK